jgi:hypothetical protein
MTWRTTYPGAAKGATAPAAAKALGHYKDPLPPVRGRIASDPSKSLHLP